MDDKMSIGVKLTLYVVNKKDLENDDIIIRQSIPLGKSCLIDYFINLGGIHKPTVLPPNKKIKVLRIDPVTESGSIVDKDTDIYGKRLTFVASQVFKDIPKNILAKESQVQRDTVRHIQSLEDSVVILYYT